MIERVRAPRRMFLRRLAQLAAGMPLIAATSGRGQEALPPLARPRAVWGAAISGPGMRPHRIERITLHHTGPPAWYGAPVAAAYLRAIQAFHTGPERGWPDIAYHLLIDLDGTVWEGRPLTFAGDTATAYDPAGHALVAVLGNYDVQRPSATQATAIVSTVRWLRDAYNLAAEALGGHRDYAATNCPGRSLYALLDELRGAG